ncbi:hypothetical protein [Gilvimarinus xylanilyticus]|uniref:Uncharacterized protein n=1 Tax=Gilvimarinus xylanilyticus TaxID=2944139 RepID=A0A9X2I6W9_9GAMM|nr:hypothetical protein [Gilvimarinus xylanilyticus]MCP8900577.1 hypothetical protein [Gilvimarinus xylanilyticus]
MSYKKMAGTCAVFIDENDPNSSAQERDGLTWSAEELHVSDIPEQLTRKAPMQNSLSLEGLEDYDPPSHGDVRLMQCINSDFVYIVTVKAWVQYQSCN